MSRRDENTKKTGTGRRPDRPSPERPARPAEAPEPRHPKPIVSRRDERGVPYPGDWPNPLGGTYRGCF